MQELIEKLHPNFFTEEEASYFLEKEKQTIIDAANNSYLNSELVKRSSQNKKVNTLGEQYYNETFKQ